MGAMVHYGFIIHGDGRAWGGKLSYDTQAHQFRPVGHLWAVDARNELESAASDSRARPRSLAGMSKYRLHNQFAAIAMPLPM